MNCSANSVRPTSPSAPFAPFAQAATGSSGGRKATLIGEGASRRLPPSYSRFAHTQAETSTLGHMGNLRAISGSWGRTMPPTASRAIRAKLLVDAEHYQELVCRAVANATVSVWMATANLKTMLVEAPIGTRARARGRYV